MVFLRKSLSQDIVDHYSQTWAFLFVLLLSILTLFIPLSPSITFSKSGSMKKPISTMDITSPIEKSVVYPLYQADCWTPSQFTDSMVAYSNGLATGAINDLVRGKNTSSGTNVYLLLLDSENPIDERVRGGSALTAEMFRQSEDSSDSVDEQKSQEDREKKRKEMEAHQQEFDEKNTKVQADIKNLLCYTTPLYLFLFAICLRLPHAIWSLLTTCCGCINVDQTLATAQTALTLDSATGNKLRENISENLKKSSKSSASLLYMFMKLLMVVVVCAEVVVVQDSLLSETEKLENDLTVAETMKDHVMELGKTKPSKPNNESSVEFPYSIVLVDFTIRQLQTVQIFTLQCAVTESSSDSSPSSHHEVDTMHESKPTPSSSSGSEKKVVLLCKALFTILLALFVVLVICNVISLVIWLFKLVLSSCKACAGLPANASLDMAFITSMAWCNTSVVVAGDIANCSGGGERGGKSAKEEEAMPLN